MRKKIFAALLFILTGLVACSGGTHTCTLSGLTAGNLYSYSYVDGDGHAVGGDFIAKAPSIDIPNVPNSAGCDISVTEIILLFE